MTRCRDQTGMEPARIKLASKTFTLKRSSVITHKEQTEMHSASPERTVRCTGSAELQPALLPERGPYNNWFKRIHNRRTVFPAQLSLTTSAAQAAHVSDKWQQIM
jgi:hypothetical protein